MFFSAIHSRGGSNNSPTCYQFVRAYKRLLVHTELMTLSFGANCTAQNFTKILTVSSNSKCVNDSSNIYLDMLCAELPKSNENDLTNFYWSPSDILNTLEHNIIEYIAGFVIRRLQNKILCDECISVMMRTHTEHDSLINIKDKGKLIKPSVDVIHDTVADY